MKVSFFHWPANRITHGMAGFEIKLGRLRIRSGIVIPIFADQYLPLFRVFNARRHGFYCFGVELRCDIFGLAVVLDHPLHRARFSFKLTVDLFQEALVAACSAVAAFGEKLNREGLH